ncbi:hypothetical protein [Pseudomonas sp. NA-150]|uniref:hypothetical protein n=1 Tax=Pseudomonas sp. NA-150 TaxID=3367525 RepID=UPI0037C60016
MTPERFVHLADAYGADLQRWPASERDAAQALLAGGDVRALEALHQAHWLDGRLDSHHLAAPTPGLAQRIAASAIPAPSTSFWARYIGWLSPAGFVGAGLAGVAVGMMVASLSLPLSTSSEALPSVFDQSDADIVSSFNVEEIDP